MDVTNVPYKIIFKNLKLLGLLSASLFAHVQKWNHYFGQVLFLYRLLHLNITCILYSSGSLLICVLDQIDLNMLICQYRILKVNPLLFSYNREMKLTVIANRCSPCRLRDMAQQLSRQLRTEEEWPGFEYSPVHRAGSERLPPPHLQSSALSLVVGGGGFSHPRASLPNSEPAVPPGYTTKISGFSWCGCPAGSCRTAAAALRK